MANAREMRLRIRSVGNIAQVTRALEAVSASKVRKAQASVEASRDYARRVASVLGRIGAYSQGSTHPLLVPRDKVENIAILLISSDRGLAGPYNMNVTRAALEFAQEKSQQTRWVTLGQKGRDLAYVRGANIVGDFSSFKSSPSFSDVTPIARVLIDDYLDAVVDEVYVAYTDYVNTIRQDTRVVRIPKRSNLLRCFRRSCIRKSIIFSSLRAEASRVTATSRWQDIIGSSKANRRKPR